LTFSLNWYAANSITSEGQRLRAQNWELKNLELQVRKEYLDIYFHYSLKTFNFGDSCLMAGTTRIR
jgi:ABC-type long-subunit fatty acid transport system fused permease/ATPase subunit